MAAVLASCATTPNAAVRAAPEASHVPRSRRHAAAASSGAAASSRLSWHICARRTRLCCRAQSSGQAPASAATESISISISSAASSLEAAADSPAAVLATAAKTQLLRCQLGSGATLWLEVVRSKQGRVEALCSGELLQLSVDAAGQVAAAPAGFLPRLGDAWVKGTPGLQDSIKKIRQQQAAEGSLPSQLIAGHGVAALQPLQTMAQFQAEVAAAPGLWCDGTAPGDPPLTEQQQALLTAGELAAFLAGQRGVCLLQLYKGWGDTSASLQPLLRPWVLPLLQAAAEHKGVALLPSAALGQLGATLVLCSRQQPFHAWGKHLASQGVQSSIVADSAFYKLLIGRILGYKEENIYHHIRCTGGSVTDEVVRAVDAELAGLSSAPPQLPWASAGRKR